MKPLIIDALLAMAILASWLGTVGFARLRGPLDRMHCVAFVNIASGGVILIAAGVFDGVSDRFLKIILLNGLTLMIGAILAHATGRAITVRESRR